MQYHTRFSTKSGKDFQQKASQLRFQNKKTKLDKSKQTRLFRQNNKAIKVDENISLYIYTYFDIRLRYIHDQLIYEF